ncbi:MAG TPA: class I SAM-dependent methyltransferase, partial [Solirubrobacteraceae bacterium]|nr:class I SAM-dependent methyltransferase [Solirubrobacteraceae bacterium]
SLPTRDGHALTAEQIRDFNTRYHDVAADEYDFKWGIDFGPAGQTQVLGKLRKAMGGRIGRYGRSLEIGCGTGYFSLNLLQAGVVDDAVCTDISPGMVGVLRANAERLGVTVSGVVGDAEQLPFEDSSFDLVFGHAVLHHIPALDRAFREFHRVLCPGGSVVFAGEPSCYGDRLAAVPKRAGLAVAPVWRALMRAGPAGAPGGHGGADPVLEHLVDVHAFTPRALAEAAHATGFAGVRVRGEELLANWFGWINRALEATAEPTEVPWLWRQYAYRGYLLLQGLDRWLLEPRLPPALFYNLMIAARKPGA